jgi:hypothetical protein
VTGRRLRVAAVRCGPSCLSPVMRAVARRRHGNRCPRPVFRPEGGRWPIQPRTKASVLACDQAVPRTDPRITLRCGAGQLTSPSGTSCCPRRPVARSASGKRPRCVAIRQDMVPRFGSRSQAGHGAVSARPEHKQHAHPRKQAAPLAGAPPRSTSCLATKRAPSLSVRWPVLYLTA